MEGAAVPGESELHPEVSSSTVTKRLDTDGLTSQPYRGRSWCPPRTELPSCTRGSATVIALASGATSGHSALVSADEEAERYRATLDEMATLAEGTTSPKEWNRLVKANHASYLLLRETEVGRITIEALMSDDSPTVRSWAAAHALLWNEGAARPVLEALETDGGLLSVSAKYALKEFDRGRLSHDW